ncbi:MAG: transposase, partial [Lachnospiraceae bacterium]|nr:transposase [Lachnospiraceae bacterium]
GKLAATKDGEVAKIHNFLDTDKIETEALYDGMYAVATDLLDDDVRDILKVSEGRWEIEENFRIMKTDFEARPVFLQRETRITAHFLTCFLALMIYRYLEKTLGNEYTCGEIVKTLRDMDFASVQEQGYIPLYKRDKLTDALHNVCGFRTDYEFITKQDMKTIQKKSKNR